MQTYNENETQQDISKLDGEKISYELQRKITTEVKSNSRETKQIKKKGENNEKKSNCTI